jgi:hypothetical protein
LAKGRVEAAERIYVADRACGGQLLLPEALFEFGDGGEADEMAFNSRREFAEEGHEFFADPIAEEAGVVVGGVVPPRKVPCRKILADGLPGDTQQRSDKAGPGSGQDAAETGWSGTAEEAEEDGLGLVGGGVTRRDPVDDAFSPPLGEEPEAGLTAGLLQISHHRAPLRHVNGQIAGQAADEGFVGIGVGAAEAVVDVEDDEGAVVESAKGVEEEDAIGAAGDGGAEGGAGEVEPFERRSDRFEHVSR